MDLVVLIATFILIYLLCIVVGLIICMLCGLFKLIYDCIKYCTVNDNFILGFINIKDNKNINLSPV